MLLADNYKPPPVKDPRSAGEPRETQFELSIGRSVQQEFN